MISFKIRINQVHQIIFHDSMLLNLLNRNSEMQMLLVDYNILYGIIKSITLVFKTE